VGAVGGSRRLDLDAAGPDLGASLEASDFGDFKTTWDAVQVAYFRGPDDNGWVIQEVTTRAPGGEAGMPTTFDSGRQVPRGRRRRQRLGEPREAHYEAVPRVVFTDPQAAAMGGAEGRFSATTQVSEVRTTATYTRAPTPTTTVS
jgi:hypothetical protein